MDNSMIRSYDGGFIKALHESVSKRHNIIVIVSEIRKSGLKMTANFVNDGFQFRAYRMKTRRMKISKPAAREHLATNNYTPELDPWNVETEACMSLNSLVIRLQGCCVKGMKATVVDADETQIFDFDDEVVVVLIRRK